ncbi:Ribonuclease H domain [Sesbania bispinosa]|nr:Ribonuclease H domain [Sesbania bispinosa]
MMVQRKNRRKNLANPAQNPDKKIHSAPGGSRFDALREVDVQDLMDASVNGPDLAIIASDCHQNSYAGHQKKRILFPRLAMIWSRVLLQLLITESQALKSMRINGKRESLRKTKESARGCPLAQHQGSPLDADTVLSPSCLPASKIIGPAQVIDPLHPNVVMDAVVDSNIASAGHMEIDGPMYLASKYQLDLLAILEPQVSGRRATNIIRRCIEASGFSGGIWILWNESNVKVDIISSHPQYVHMKICPLISGLPWFLTYVYASPRVHQRRVLWQELCHIPQRYSFPTCILTDDLGRYLGVPLLHRRPSNSTYDFILQKTQQRLSSWRAESLAFAGLSKYGCGGDIIPRVRKKSSESLLWRGIRTWCHIQQDVCVVPFQEVWNVSLVCEFSEPNMGWNIQLLQFVLPEEVVMEIIGYPHPHDSFGADSVAWSGTSNGVFSTRSAYELVSCKADSTPDPIWKAVWRWRGPERARCFMWLVLNKGPKTKHKGFRCGLYDSDVCPVCLQHIETPLHVLRDCLNAKNVWSSLGGTNLPPNFYSVDITDWFKMNLIGGTGGNWSLIFGLSVWQLWRCRNERVFDNKAVSSVEVVGRIHNLARIGDAHCLSGLDQNHRGMKLVRWCSPEQGWIKFNVDGSVKSASKSTGCGGVMRDHCGNWMGGFFFNLGSSSVLMAELRGIATALHIAWGRGLTKLWIESDSLTAIELITKGINLNHPYNYILSQILAWRNKPWQLYFSHTVRECNSVVDYLANKAHVLPLDIHQWVHPLGDCSNLLLGDRVGVFLYS